VQVIMGEQWRRGARTWWRGRKAGTRRDAGWGGVVEISHEISGHPAMTEKNCVFLVSKKRVHNCCSTTSCFLSSSKKGVVQWSGVNVVKHRPAAGPPCAAAALGGSRGGRHCASA